MSAALNLLILSLLSQAAECNLEDFLLQFADANAASHVTLVHHGDEPNLLDPGLKNMFKRTRVSTMSLGAERSNPTRTQEVFFLLSEVSTEEDKAALSRALERAEGRDVWLVPRNQSIRGLDGLSLTSDVFIYGEVPLSNEREAEGEEEKEGHFVVSEVYRIQVSCPPSVLTCGGLYVRAEYKTAMRKKTASVIFRGSKEIVPLSS